MHKTRKSIDAQQKAETIKNKCPNCNVEYENAHVGDADGGGVLVSIQVEYCPECLYINNSNINLSK